MGMLRMILGMAIMFGCIYLMLTRRTIPVPLPPGQTPGSAQSGPGQTVHNMKKQFEAAQQKEDEHGDAVQKKLDDAVQGK